MAIAYKKAGSAVADGYGGTRKRLGKAAWHDEMSSVADEIGICDSI